MVEIIKTSRIGNFLNGVIGNFEQMTGIVYLFLRDISDERDPHILSKITIQSGLRVAGFFVDF